MDLVLVNYHHSDSTPLKSITQLPYAEARKIADKLYENSQVRAHRRFGPDFPQYYEYRLEVEAWLYERFLKRGGKPDIKHPYYFVVQTSDMLRDCFEDCRETTIPLSKIPDEYVSFTLGDSMAQSEQDSLNNMLTKAELLNRLKEYDNDIDRFITEMNQKYNFIEAQIWTDSYF